MEEPILYASPLAYPTVQVSAPNLVYAQMLTSAFASAKSELSTVTQYIYFSWILDKQESQLRDSFRHIAQVEMHHLDLLGQTITALGGNPIYRSVPCTRASFWNACMLQYQGNKEKALRISIAGEQEAIDGYHRLSKLIQDQNITNLLQRIILDEQIHLQIFQEYLTIL